jgi:hypothetical protein
MISMRHECLVDLFKNRPSLAAELLVEVLRVALPTYSEARVVSADLTEIQPAEYRADIVVLLLDNGKPVRADRARSARLRPAPARATIPSTRRPAERWRP